MKVFKILLLGLVIATTACDDFLDINPQGEVVDKDLFTSTKGFEDAIYGCYGYLTNENLYGRDLSWCVLDMQAQYFAVDKDNEIDFALVHYKTQTPEYINKLSAKWKYLYKAIGQVNNVIAQIEKGKADGFSKKKLYHGEMLAMRAFLHFEAVKLYAEDIKRGPNKKGIPYVKTFSYKVTKFSTVSEVYTEIIKDLEAAEKLLAEDTNLVKEYDVTNSSFKSIRQIHLNLYAVKSILARVYWHKGEMNTAMKYAKQVIDSEKFELAKRSEVKTMIAGTLSKKESIWGLYFEKYIDITGPYLHQDVSKQSLDLYEDAGGDIESFQELYNYDMIDGETGSDARLKHFGESSAAKNTRCLKIVDQEKIDNNKSEYSRGLVPAVSMIRISEMYYIMAEALLHTNATEARKYFDMVLENRGIIPFAKRTPEKVLTMENINNERKKEFFCEGREWFNMKRQFRDIKSNAANGVVPASTEIYNWPIPKEEFEYRY